MTKFKQKEFTEYDAMKSLYNEIMKRTGGDKRKFPIINSSAFIPILKGNSVVIERFVISTSMFGKDKYRMYLKIGAKAKLPDEVRLPNKYYDKSLGGMKLTFKGGVFGKQKQESTTQEEGRLKLFGNNNGGNKKGAQPMISGEATPYVDLKYQVSELLGEAIKYDKKDRSLVLEFSSIGDAINALNILPFGLEYKIYLLDA
ncbi:MAG: hypothetical protein IJ880_12495 [Bacilli bacterium]|nr:hypothetical protein [Bacilli bacterium]